MERGRAPLRRIFVYGTLLAGESNHRLLRTARLLGRARTEAAWTMVSLGGFPGVHVGGETSIAGEVYEVDTATLAELDRLEGHPSFYRRTSLRLDGHIDVETYLLTPAQVEGCPLIISGCWRTHRKEKTR
ncbi:MAG: gamma-glutamylcyclotransferase [Myxococcaceae bacterium]|nr:MAG: gamma-glutamylcyclotransferase [Myxococcaceae bacterium]